MVVFVRKSSGVPSRTNSAGGCGRMVENTIQQIESAQFPLRRNPLSERMHELRASSEETPACRVLVGYSEVDFDVLLRGDRLAVEQGGHIPPVFRRIHSRGCQRWWAANQLCALDAAIRRNGQVNLYRAFNLLLLRFERVR